MTALICAVSLCSADLSYGEAGGARVTGSWSDVLPFPLRRALGWVPSRRHVTEEYGVAPADYLAHIQTKIESRLKGQPEAVNAVMSIEKTTAFYGYRRETPVPLVLMGMPGSGKDTLIQSWMDAVYGYTGAWREHVFQTPILRNHGDLWSLIGSATGYHGSMKLSPLIHWLVLHSGGRYKIRMGHVIENKNWKPGEVLPGYFAPEHAVLFANEFQNWSKQLTDSFLKQALDHGYFTINNPGAGLSRIYVPVNIAIATNSGINLIAARELNGQRYGAPLTHEQMMARWALAKDDESKLRSELARVNGLPNQSANHETSPGISEEVLDRLDNLVLMRPNSPQVMREIVLTKLEDLENKIASIGTYGHLVLAPSSALIDFLVNYEYQAESSARGYNRKITNLIEAPLVDAIQQGVLHPPRHSILTLGILDNGDGTSSLSVQTEDGQNERLAIPHTERTKAPEALSKEDIGHLLTLRSRINKHVVGLDGVLARVVPRVIVSEDARRARVTPENATTRAQSYMFLGPSSTGKNELAKGLARELLGDDRSYELIDFSRVQSKHDLEQLILGVRDSSGNGMPSPFMKAYDRLYGRVIFTFDEVANAPKEVLNALYDILREPVVTTFSDGKPRVMSNVIIIMTGNAGEEWYLDIPRNIPEIEQQEAMEQIYAQAMADPDFVRRFLESRFSPALLNRVGLENIFFFPSLNFAATRELALLKLMKVLAKLKPQAGRFGWPVVFASEGDFVALADVIENEGFILWEQGASIDRYANATEDALRTCLSPTTWLTAAP